MMTPLSSKISILNEGMPNDIIAQIQEFIRGRRQSVTALDIAQHVLCMTNATERGAEIIVDGLLKMQPQFEKVGVGLWHIRQVDSVAEPLSFVICTLFPERAPVQRLHKIYLARFVHDHFRDQIIFELQPDSFFDSAQKVNDWIGNAVVIFDGFGNQISNFNWLMSLVTFSDADRTVLSLRKLITKLRPECSISSASDISKALTDIFHDDNEAAQFSSYQSQVVRTVELLRERNINDLQSVQEFINDDRADIDFSRFAFAQQTITEMTTSAGVYLMKDKTNQVIYVGKAKNLRRRLQTYFNVTVSIDDKLSAIRDQLYTLDVVETGSELEALLREYELIHHYDPPINRQFDVHPRAGYSKERYARILFLPSTDEQIVHVLFFNPPGHTLLTPVQKSNIDAVDLQNKVQQVFAAPSVAHMDQVEIITSWLTHHPEVLSSIDMRTVASAEDAVRLIQLHVLHFDPQHRQIFQ